MNKATATFSFRRGDDHTQDANKYYVGIRNAMCERPIGVHFRFPEYGVDPEEYIEWFKSNYTSVFDVQCIPFITYEVVYDQ